MFRIYFAGALLMFIIVALFGLAVPRLISAKSDELVLAGFLKSIEKWNGQLPTYSG